MSGINLGDVIFQLFSLLFIVGVFSLIISLVLSNKKRRNQLDTIEKKIDVLIQKQNKNNE